MSGRAVGHARRTSFHEWHAMAFGDRCTCDHDRDPGRCVRGRRAAATGEAQFPAGKMVLSVDVVLLAGGVAAAADGPLAIWLSERVWAALAVWIAWRVGRRP